MFLFCFVMDGMPDGWTWFWLLRGKQHTCVDRDRVGWASLKVLGRGFGPGGFGGMEWDGMARLASG